MDRWRAILTVVAVIGVVIFLAVWRAGVLAPALIISAAGLCLVYLITARPATMAMRKQSLCAILFAALILLTLAPLPVSRALGGARRAEQNSIARDALQTAVSSGSIVEADTWFALSRNRAGTHRYLLMLIGAIAAGALVAGMSKPEKALTLAALTYVAAIVAAAGLASQHVIPQGRYLWWIFPFRHGVESIGSFINRNHFAGYVGMFAPVSLALLAASCRRRQASRIVLYALCFTAIAVAVTASKSRGAFLACGIGTLLTIVVLLARRRIAAVTLTLLLIAVVSAAIKAAPLEDVHDRLASFKRLPDTLSAKLRWSTWKDSITIMADYPIVGIGANSFRMIFPQYRTASTRKTFFHAENEFVQIPVETGVAGTFLLLGLMAFSLRAWQRGAAAGRIAPETSVAVFGAAVVVGTHAFLDYALRIPLYTISAAAVWGMILGEERDATNPAQDWDGSLNRTVLLGIAPAIIALIYTLSVAMEGRAIDRRDHADRIEHASAEALARSLAWSPTSWQVWYHLGRDACANEDLPRGEELCAAWIAQALEYNPNDYRLWRNYANLLKFRLNDAAGARRASARANELRSWVGAPLSEPEPVPES